MVSENVNVSFGERMSNVLKAGIQIFCEETGNNLMSKGYYAGSVYPTYYLENKYEGYYLNFAYNGKIVNGEEVLLFEVIVKENNFSDDAVLVVSRFLYEDDEAEYISDYIKEVVRVYCCNI